MDKKQWALNIGYFLISMNEIDGMTFDCQEKVIGKKASKNWTKKSLKERLDDLCENIKTDDCNNKKELLDLLRRASAMCPLRNQIAHGQFILDCDRPFQEREPNSQMTIYSYSNSLKPARAEQIKEAAKNCVELSDAISRCLSVIQMQRMKSHSKNEP